MHTAGGIGRPLQYRAGEPGPAPLALASGFSSKASVRSRSSYGGGVSSCCLVATVQEAAGRTFSDNTFCSFDS